MKCSRGHNPFFSQYAVLGLPFYLLIAIIITGAILSVFALGLQNIITDSTIHQVEQEINKITTEATNMYEYANEGTNITVHVEFPSSLRCIVFGALPKNGTAEPSLITFDENTSNNYYFVLKDGTVRSYHSNARFSTPDFTHSVILHPGVYTLTLQLCFYEGKSYVTIYY